MLAPITCARARHSGSSGSVVKIHFLLCSGGVATVGNMAEPERGERLFKACEDGDIDAVKSIVAEGADPRRVRWNTYSHRVESPLHAACR